MAWNIGIAVVVVLGVVGIVVSKQSSSVSSADVAPRASNSVTNTTGDNWHAAIGVNVCGSWLSAAPPFQSTVGIDTAVATNATDSQQGDGLIHIAPSDPSAAGKHATLGKFLSDGGWSASASDFDLWDNGKKSNGDTCPGTSGKKSQPGRVVWTVDGKVQQGNPSDYRLQDCDVIAIGFLPKGQKLGLPPEMAALANVPDAANPTLCSSVVDRLGGTTTTAAGSATTAVGTDTTAPSPTTTAAP
jgi:hypothetical protein